MYKSVQSFFKGFLQHYHDEFKGLIDTRFVCNESLAEDPYLVVGQKEDKTFNLGALGLISGCLRYVLQEERFFIVALFSEEDDVEDVDFMNVGTGVTMSVDLQDKSVAEICEMLTEYVTGLMKLDPSALSKMFSVNVSVNIAEDSEVADLPDYPYVLAEYTSEDGNRYINAFSLICAFFHYLKGDDYLTYCVDFEKNEARFYIAEDEISEEAVES